MAILNLPSAKLAVRLAALALILISIACIGSVAGDCGNEVIQESTSPDGKMKAVVFVRNCGATTAFSTQVSIIKASSALPNQGGNILALGDHGDASGKYGGKIQIAVSWTDDHHLRITAPTFSGNFLQTQEYSGITVAYVASP